MVAALSKRPFVASAVSGGSLVELAGGEVVEGSVLYLLERAMEEEGN